MDNEPEYTSGNYASFNEEPNDSQSDESLPEFIEIETKKRDINGNKVRRMTRKRRRGGKKRSLTSKKRSLPSRRQGGKSRK